METIHLFFCEVYTGVPSSQSLSIKRGECYFCFRDCEFLMLIDQLISEFVILCPRKLVRVYYSIGFTFQVIQVLLYPIFLSPTYL